MSDLRCPKGCKPKTVRAARAGLYRCNCCGFSAVRRSFELTAGSTELMPVEPTEQKLLGGETS